MTKLVFIYVNYNCALEIHESISSIQLENYEVSVIVCDNSGNYSPIENETVFSPGRNIGYLNGFNYCAMRSDGDIICLVNPDIVFESFELPLDYDLEEGRVFAPFIFDSLGGNHNPYKTSLPSFGNLLLNFSAIIIEIIGARSMSKLRNFIRKEVRVEPIAEENIVPHGSFVVFANCNLTQLLSPWNSLYFEEEKIAFWAKKSGYRVQYCPEITVKHLQKSPSTSRINPRRKLLVKLKSLLELMLYFAR